MGFWYRRTRLEKYLIYVSILFIILSIGLMIGVIVVKNRNSKVSESESICESIECLISAAELQSSLNLTADPCDDFYEYSCGGWMRNNIIGPERSRWSQFDVTRKKLLDTLRVLLENEKNNNYPQIIDQTIGLYKQCMNMTNRNSEGLSQLKTIITEIKWPMISKEPLVNYNWSDVFSKLNKENGFNFVLSNYVYLDAKNTTLYSIYIDAPSFGVGRAQLVAPETENNKKILQKYKEFIKASVTLLADKPEDIDSETIDKDIEDLVNFESKLANITADAASRRNRTTLYGTKIDLAQFIQNSTINAIPLLNIEQQVFKGIEGVKIDGNSPLIVYDRKYFESLGEVLKGTDDKVKANYMSWRTVKSLGSYTSKAFRDIEFEFTKAVSGVEEPKALWEDCVETVNNGLTFSVGRLYVDQNFPKEARDDMESMIDQLDNAFSQLLDDNQWMAEETKTKARKKLKDMLRSIGYPDYIKNDTKLNDYYKDLNLKTKTYFESIKNINLWESEKSLKKLFSLNTNRSELEWSTGPAIVNAFFSPNINKITFPAGILQSPFYTYGLPIALNLGAIGVVIGHEITHSFDDSGSQYDEYGNLHNWWDPNTQKQFTEKVKCFIDQYSNYTDPIANKPINGSTTIGENIGDNGGLRQAFKALENYSGNKQLLPTSMKSFTNEQLFFISFANIWCTNIRREALINQIETDPHSPGKYRVWGSVSNSESFAKAFNCKSEAKMNPKSKCILW